MQKLVAVLLLAVVVSAYPEDAIYKVTPNKRPTKKYNPDVDESLTKAIEEKSALELLAQKLNLKTFVPISRQRREAETEEDLQRDNRAVDLLGAIGGGTGGSYGASASAGVGGGSGSGSILNVLPSLLGSSSGGGGDADSGGGSNAIDLVSGLLGSSSGGGGSGGGDSSSGGGGGGSNIFGFIGPILSASSGGGDGEGGGSNVLSLFSSFLGAIGATGDVGNSYSSKFSLLTSLLNGASNFKGGARRGPPPAKGTYDDLIGKGISGYDPVYVLSKSISGALSSKVNGLKSSVTNLVGGIFRGNSGGSGGASAGASVGAGLGGLTAGAGVSLGGDYSATAATAGGYP